MNLIMSKETFIVETLRQAHIDNREGYCELGFLRVEASTMEEAEVKAEAFIKDQEKEGSFEIQVGNLIFVLFEITIYLL
ncbi:hypothetical protein MNBD_GAMMA04-1410 [hydrothermal vent metagenome]|uniref:Uncharacterized protein n=1 Tax=hydrothermal vent metagenome TaxID=652676 RepID=A0A3B0WYF1_9ZZZZ